MPTLRSTRRRLLAGTGATVALNYALHVPGSSGLTGGPIYLNSSWNVVQFANNVKVASTIDPNNSSDTMLVDPLNQWYYIKTGNAGTSQRSNNFGFVQTTLANMTQRFVMRSGTAITELQASGTTESYAGGSCDMHPAGDVIMNWMSAGATSFKAWSKNANNDWSYFSPMATKTFVDKVRYSKTGNYMAVTRQTGAQPYVVYLVSNRFSTYTEQTCNFSDANQGGAVAFESDSTLVVCQSGSPWINYYTRSGTVWSAGNTILTDNPSGLVGTDLKNTVSKIAISPDATIMLVGVNAITAPGKGHHLFYKQTGKWVYQGQLPSAVSGTALINDIKFTADGAFLLVAWASGGIQVWSCTSGAVAHLKQLQISDGLQNGESISTSSNHPYFGVATVGAWSDPAGRSEIDNQIELVSPAYWYKFNEQFNYTDNDLVPVIRNFGSKLSGTGATGNVSVNKTALTTTATARVSGPPSVTASYAMRVISGQNNNLTTNSTSRIDDPSSGSVAFFIKFTSNVATWRGIFDDGALQGSNGLHFGIYAGKLVVQMGTTGASARDYSTNSTFNDGNWHFVVWNQPADGTGLTCTIDGVSAGLTVNLAGLGSSGATTTLINWWFDDVATGAFSLGGDPGAVQYDIAHLFILTNAFLSAGQISAIKSAAGL